MFSNKAIKMLCLSRNKIGDPRLARRQRALGRLLDEGPAARDHVEAAFRRRGVGALAGDAPGHVLAARLRGEVAPAAGAGDAPRCTCSKCSSKTTRVRHGCSKKLFNGSQ